MPKTRKPSFFLKAQVAFLLSALLVFGSATAYATVLQFNTVSFSDTNLTATIADSGGSTTSDNLIIGVNTTAHPSGSYSPSTISSTSLNFTMTDPSGSGNGTGQLYLNFGAGLLHSGQITITAGGLSNADPDLPGSVTLTAGGTTATTIAFPIFSDSTANFSILITYGTGLNAPTFTQQPATPISSAFR